MARARADIVATLFVSVLSVLLIGSAGHAAAVTLAPGDIVACDPVAGDHGALVVVDPVSGDVEVLSDLDDPGQGPLGERPWDVVLDSAASIVLLDSMIPAVFRVDPATGQRILLSDLSDSSQGPTGIQAWAIAGTAAGGLVVALGGTNPLLLAVDPDTGDRTIVSDFDEPTQGVLGVPMGVVEEPAGDFLVTAFLDGGTSALLRVEAGTGDRTIVSDFGEPGPAINGLTGIALDAQGQALVPWASAQNCFTEIFRVDPEDGSRESVGLLGIHAWDVAVEADGQILAAGFRGGFCGPGFNRLYRIDPASGMATPLADDVNSGLAVYVLDVVFSDGFESGDLSAWSSSSP